MQNLFNTTWMYPESWIKPGDISSAYQWFTDTFFINSQLFDGLGGSALILGVFAVIAIPAVWGLARLNRV